MKMHRWTAEDDAALLAAMVELIPLLDVYRERGSTKAMWWDAVAGRLAPGVCVTGRACARREQTLRELRVAEDESLYRSGVIVQREASDQAWLRVAEQVEAYEEDRYEQMAAQGDRIEGAVRSLSAKVSALCAVWGVE